MDDQAEAPVEPGELSELEPDAADREAADGDAADGDAADGDAADGDAADGDAADGDAADGDAGEEAPARRRRRSRNRGRHRRGSGETGSESDSGDGTETEQAGDGAAPKPARTPVSVLPPTYGPLEAAFFDLDKTVIAKASMVAFGRPFYRGGLINRRTVLRALYGELVYLHLGASEQKLNQIRESVLLLIRGWHSDRVREIVAEAIEAIVEPIIFAEAADLIDFHHEHGRLVVIVSASPEEIVIPLSRFLGADECIASRARVDEEGRYTGKMQFYAFGPFKAEAMDKLAYESGIDLAASYAYTDSYTDLPMLEAVGHPVAVNPDRVLNRYAREHDFEILHFSQTVSLWSRVRDRLGAVPPRPAIAASAGAVALGVGAATAGWWLGSRRRDS
jgi:HAD superfamily hydrolase (TIGR01490 family)